jgi:PAS domain S-box-containing protein
MAEHTILSSKNGFLWPGFVAAFIALAVVGWAAYNESSRYYYWNSWILHTQLVLDSLDEARVDSFRAVVVGESYYHSGDRQEQDNFKVLASKLQQLSAHLRTLTRDNPSQQARLDRLDPILQHIFDLANGPAHGSAIPQLPAQPPVPAELGAAFFDLRDLLQQMSTEENRLLMARLNSAHAASGKSVTTIAVGGSLIFTWLLFLSAYAAVTSRRLTQAAQSLAASRDELVRAAERRKADEQFRALLESAPDALVIVSQDGRIVLVNAQTETLFGYRKEELVGQPIDALVPERFRARHPEYRARYFASSKPRPMGAGLDLAGLRKDGTEFAAEISLSPIPTPEGTLVTAAVRDVSERKRLEQEQYRRINEANRLKSEFLANMSHELRTPLNAIIGFASLIQGEKVGTLNENQKEYLGDILASSRHLLLLINDVLDLAKIEAGKMKFRSEPVDLAATVHEVTDILRGLAAEKRIRIGVELSPALPTVTIDPAKFKQVLYNYLSNAIKFTPEKGAVTVRIQPEGDDRLRLEVEDTGIGIAPKDIHRLFVEFQQLDSGPTKKYSGTGLGLSLTKRIVETQGGTVSVQSVLGKGSTFAAVLPRVIPSSEETLTSLPTPPGTDGLPVLVIDDDRSDREWLVRTITGAGYSVEAAATGAEAVQLCNKRAFAAITLDLLLPDASGWDVLREIRSTPLNQRVPAIAVTVTRDQGLSSAFVLHDYLVKPVESHILLQSLKQAGLYAGNGAILLVDNDRVLLKLVSTNLNQSGYRAACAESAEEALEMVRKDPPAIIVLELLLAGMDGFQFLDELRRTPTGRRIPVIVWTMKDLSLGERRRLRASVQAIMQCDGVNSLIEQLNRYLTKGTRDLNSDSAGGGAL